MRTLLLVVLRPLSCLGCPNFGMLKGRGQGCLSDAPQLLCRLEPAGGEVGHTHYKSLQNKIGTLTYTRSNHVAPKLVFFFDVCTKLRRRTTRATLSTPYLLQFILLQHAMSAAQNVSKIPWKVPVVDSTGKTEENWVVLEDKNSTVAKLQT